MVEKQAMQKVSKQTMDKLTQLDDKQLQRLLLLVEHKRKDDERKEIEYDYLKEKSVFKEVPFRSSTPEGEMVSNLDNFQNLMQNTRVSGTEINALYRYMTLVRAGIYPDLGLDQIYMALKISEAGKGRSEKVSIVTGSKSQRSDADTFWQKLFKSRKLEVEDGTNQ